MALLKRRKFLKFFTIFNFTLFLSSIIFAIYKFVSYPLMSKIRIVKINKNKLANGVNEFAEDKIAIIKNNNKYFIINTTCTHLGCVVKWNNNLKIFECPCHKSAFDIQGRVLRGPAKFPLYKVKFKTEKENLILWLKNL